VREHAIPHEFYDGDSLDLVFNYDERLVIAEINHPGLMQRYHLEFLRCFDIHFELALYDEPWEVDMANVNWIKETPLEGGRQFTFTFRDREESTLTICCKDFWMEPISGYENYGVTATYK